MKTAPTTLRILALLCICIVLTTVWAGCASDPDAVISSATIPEGWEVVSTEENVTHLQLKEDSDAYHWVDRYGWQLRESNANLPLDVQIVGNEDKKPISPDKDGNVYFIVYYGRFYAEEIDGKFQIVDAPEEDIQSPMTLHMESGGKDIMGNLSGTSLFPEPWSLDEFVEYNDVLFEPLEKVNRNDPEARVGLKRAALIACPYNKLDTGWETLIFRTQQRDGSSGDYSEEDYLSYATYHNTVYFEEEDLAKDTKVIATLTGVELYFIITSVLFLSSFVIMIISAILKKSSFLHFIPLLIGCLHSYALINYLRISPLPDSEWGFGAALLLFIIPAYLVHGVILLLIRLVINWICKSFVKSLPKKKSEETQDTSTDL